MRPISQTAFLVILSCALLGLSPAEGQTLKLRYPLNDATANTYYPPDTSLGGVNAANLITASSANAAVNKHGSAGSGVGGITPAMDFTGQADGAAGPIAYNTADSNLGFGLVTNWTVTLWFNQDPANGTTGSGSQQPYLFLMGTNGVTGTAVANSLVVRMSPNPGTGQNQVSGDLEVLPNTIGEQDFQITTPANTQFSGWRFVAITYNDGTRTLTVYTGTTNTAVAQAVTNPKTLGGSAAINFGTVSSMSIGNRTSDRLRIYSAWYQDFRFYSGAASQATLDQIRQSILPPAITSGGQPQSGAYPPGQTAQLTVVAGGAAPLVYQWQATNGATGGFTNLVDGGQITGSQSNVLTIATVSAANALIYHVIVTNNYGSVTSAPASLAVLSVPIINSQPVSQTALSGSTVSFVVGATGVGTLGFQWQASGGSGYTNLVDNGIVSGSGTSTLTLTGVTTNFALAYQMVVTNANGSVTSAPPATLTVLPATCLINVDFGTGATQIGAAVLGSPGDVWNALSASSGTVANSAGNMLSGAGLTLNDYGVYLAAGGTATDPGTTNLMQDYAFGYSTTPTVLANITGLAPYINSAFTLVIYAAGNAVGQGGSLTLTGANGGNTGNTLTTTAASRQISAGPGVAYNTYTGVVTNGTLSFASAILPGQSFTAVNGFQLLLSPLLILTQPMSQTNFAGYTATFTVGAVGAGSLNYQWQATNAASGGFTNLIDGGQVSGSQSNVLTIANLTTNWALAYQVIVANGSGSVTSAPAASLTLLSTPIITAQPASQTSVAGSPVTFNVIALGTPPLGYQWQATNSAAGGFTNLSDAAGLVSGSTASGLTLTGVTTNFALSYQVVVTNSYGSVTSAVAALTVLASIIPPNIPDPGAMARSIVANVVGSYTAPPTKLPSNLVTGAPVVANGDLTCAVGGPSTNLQFYFSKADFWGLLRGAIQPVGSLVLNAPALSGSSYALNENIGPATLTGAFANGAASLTLTSWVASAENTTVIQLNNNGTSPLSLTSQMLDGFAGTTGNPATYGATNNSTWLNVSPDSVYLELGNQLHNQFGAAPFTGRIADLRLYNQALSGTTLGNLDGVGVPTPLLRWSTTNAGVATLVGAGASLNPADPYGGSVVLTGDSGSELAVGDLPLPESQFTFSTWVYPTTTGGNGCIVAAQIPNSQQYSGYPYPYVRGLTLKLVNGALSASLNQSGGLNTSTMLFTADAVNTYSTTATGALPANQWTQAAVTYDGNTLTIFTNGVAVGTPVTFPTGNNGMLSYNKMVVHIGDTNLPYNGCAPQGVLMQNVLGATATTSSQGALAFTIPAGGQVTLLVAAVTDRNNTNYFAAAQQQAQQATTGSLSNLFQAHGNWWSNFWSKSFVQIPNQKIQDSWYGSLYLLACCNSSNCPPPSKLGNCITSRTPGWQGDYNLDYNYEASPYTAIANNHQELMENYMKPLLEEMPRGQSTAQYLYGMTNALLYFDHWVPAPGWSDDPGTFWGQKSQSLFGAVDCVMRWRYTQDTNYAAIIYPYLKGVANFWDNYLVLNNGYYVDNNDSCWEQSGNDSNPVTTLAFIQLVYPELVKISQILNVDADRRAKWNDIIAHLTPLPIVPASSITSLNNLGAPYNAAGVNVIRNSTAGTAFPTPMVTLYQDHTVRSSSAGMSCPQVIFPGWNIGLESDPALLQAASNTVWLAAQWFDFNDNCTFYPGAACAGYDPNAILSNLNTLLTYYRDPSFVIDVGGDSTEQYAIVPATLAAMFVQSYQTNIHIFPNWPTNQSAAFANHNACGGFLISSAITLGSANYVQIQSNAGQMLNLANPWPGAVVQCISSLTGISTLSGPVLHYQTQVGEVLTLISTSVTNIPAPMNLTVNTNNSAVNLNWNAMPGAVGYNVKRSTTIGGPFLNLVSGITSTNYTDTTAAYGTIYYYTVTALAPGFESTNSASVSASVAIKTSFLIDVDIGSTANVQTGAAVLGGAGDVWNGVTTSTGTIKDSTGTTLNGIGFADANYWLFNDNTAGVATLDAATTPLMRDCVAGNTAVSGGTFTVSLTGLNAYINEPFTLVVYAAIGDANQGAKLTLSGATGGNTASTLTTTGASRSLTNQVTGGIGVAYNTFTGTLTSGTLTITAANNLSQYYGINGFQFLVAPSQAPVITVEPVSQSTYPGQNISFSVAATGAGTLFYQWQATNSAAVGFTNLIDGGQISGSQNNVLSIAGVTTNWALAYQVIVTNTSGSVTSTPPASLTILSGQPPLRLMPLGDSITRGGTDPNGGNNLPGFRDAIYTLNTNANVNFQFVGATATQSSPQLTAAGQQYHNGYASYATGSLFSNLTANVQPPVGDANVGGYWMTGGTPGGAPVQVDVVTLLSGANDIGQNPGNPLQYFTNNEINLLGWFKTNRPNTKVIVATDTPRTDSTANNNAALAINQWITNNVPNLSSNFSTVDLYPLFIDTNGVIKTHSSPDGICLQDGVHPAYNGYQAMGQAWFNAIQGAVNPNAPNFLSAVAGVNSQVTLTWSNVPAALGYNVKMSTTNGGPYALVASNLSTISYTNSGLTNGTVYYYVVSAVSGGGEGANSYQVNATPGTIPVFNHSFDNNYVAYANYLGSAPSGWTFTGSGNGQLAAVVFPASGDNRFATYPVPGLDGLNYAQIYVSGTAGSGSLYLNTGYSYVAGATYTLTAGFGIETGSGGGMLVPGAQMQLQNTGFATMAATNITSANTAANQFKDVSTTYTANGTEGNLVINFAVPAPVAGNAFLDIDNVRLSVVYPPGLAASTNAYLTSLALNPAGVLTPAFSSNTFTYYSPNAYGTTPTVTVTNADLTATNQLIYHGTTNLLASGTASSPLALTLGVTNVVQVQVTAQDGVSKQIYMVNVTELPNQTTSPSLTNRLSNATLNLSWGLDRLGYRLLMQTNNLKLGVSSIANDWATVSGSTATNAMSITIVPTNLDEYYRLVYP